MDLFLKVRLFAIHAIIEAVFALTILSLGAMVITCKI